MSAHPHVIFARPTAPHVGVTRAEAVGAARLAEIRAEARAAALPRLWQELDMSMRIVLVMLGCGQAGKAEVIAKQPWGSFSAADQLAMASSARLVRECLSDIAAVA